MGSTGLQAINRFSQPMLKRDKSDVHMGSSHSAGGRGKNHRPRRSLGQAESGEGLVRAGLGRARRVPDQALLLKEAHTCGEGAPGT